MKNNKILYILTLIITLFSFNTNVYAAQELTCVYKKGGASEKVLLIQDVGGNLKLYTNVENVGMNFGGWQQKAYYTSNSYNYNFVNEYEIEIDDDTKNSYGLLEKCPAYSNYLSKGEKTKITFFNNKNNWLKGQIDGDKMAPEALESSESLDFVQEPTSTIVVSGYNTNSLDANKYQGTCKFERYIENLNKYHYVYFDFGIDKNGIEYIQYREEDPKKGTYSNFTKYYGYKFSNNNVAPEYVLYEFNISKNYGANYFIEKYAGDCPIGIMITRIDAEITMNDPITNSSYTESNVKTTIHTDEEKKGDLYNLADSSGFNPITGKALRGVPNGDINFEKIDIKSCKDLFGDKGEEITGYFNTVWNIVKFGVPIILLGMGTLDFAQAVFSGKDDGMKKAQGKFIKRVIIAIAILLVPTLISFLLKIANGIWGNIGTDLCGLIF